MLRYIFVSVIMLRYLSLCYVICHYVTLSVIMLRYLSLCYVICHYVTLSVIMLRYGNISENVTNQTYVKFCVNVTCLNACFGVAIHISVYI